jgi:hypothetical protein
MQICLVLCKTDSVTGVSLLELRNGKFQNLHSSPDIKSKYNEWLRTGRPSSRSSSPCKGNIFLLSAASVLVLESFQPPIQRVPRLSPYIKTEWRRISCTRYVVRRTEQKCLWSSCPKTRMSWTARWEDVNWIHLAQNRGQWRALSNIVMNLWVSQRVVIPSSDS